MSIFATKSIEQLKAEAAETGGHSLKRVAEKLPGPPRTVILAGEGEKRLWPGFLKGTALAVRSAWTPIAAPLLAIVVSTMAIRYVRADPAHRSGKQIELASAVWTLLAYAMLALPWIERELA